MHVSGKTQKELDVHIKLERRGYSRALYTHSLDDEQQRREGTLRTVDGVARLSAVLHGRRGRAHLPSPPLQFLHEIFEVWQKFVERDDAVHLLAVGFLELRLHHRVDLLRRDAVEEPQA